MEQQQKIDIEKALLALGKYGKYQLRIYICANFSSFILCLQMMSMAFVNGKPDFYCSVADDKHMNGFEKGIPFSNDTTYKCFVNSTTVGMYGKNMTPEERPCGSDNRTKFAYEENFGSTIVTEWDLVCSKNYYSEFVGSVFMFGVMVGAIIVTQISDRFGRRWTYLICNWLFGIFGVALAFTNTFVSFAIIRFISGLLTSGVGMVGFVISCETISKTWRAYSTLLGCIAWSVAYVCLGAVAYFVRDWRMLTIITALPSFISIIFYWLVPETLHWLIVNGKEQEAIQWLQTAAKYNNIKIDIDQLRDLTIASEKTSAGQEDAADKKHPGKRHIFHIFSSKILLVQAVVMCYLWTCNAFVYYGLSLFSTRLSGDRYLNFILSGLVEIPAYFVAAWTLENLGRRMTTLMFHVVAGVGLFMLMFVPEKTSSEVNLLPLITTLSLVGKFAISCTFQAIFLYAAEIYPTTVRNVGCGLSSMAARIGAIVAPYVALLADANPKLPPTVFGTMSLAAAALTGFLPETKNVDLGDDINNVQAGPLQKIICRQRKISLTQDAYMQR